MCCNPCCVPLGCIPVTSTIEKPENFEAPPTKMFCPRCGHTGEPVFRKTIRFCCLFFIPCFPCGTGSTYLACPQCDFATGRITGETCSGCNVTTVSVSKFCPNCGKGREGATTAPNSGHNGDDGSNGHQGDNKKPSNGEGSSKKTSSSTAKRGKTIGEFKNQ